MKIVTTESGYVPLSVNLEPYFEKPYAELPDEAKAMLQGTILNLAYVTEQEIATFPPELREILKESIPKPLLPTKEEFARLPDPVQQYLNRTCLTEVHLTDELKARIQKAYPNPNERSKEIRLFLERFHQAPWDSWSVEHRRFLAATYDNGHDPRHEFDAYFHLYLFQEKLTEWIDKTERDGKDAAVVYLRKVEDRVNAILYADRERVGLEIQQQRKAHTEKPNGSTEAQMHQTDIVSGLDALQKCKYWQQLQEQAMKAIDAFPSWSKQQHTIQKTGNFQDWLVKEIGANNREAEILKKILSDIFQELR